MVDEPTATRHVVRTWPREGEPPEQVGRPHHPDARPLGVAISAGGFRSYACAVGQLRALRAMGLMEQVGVISAVSGGAWAASAWAFAPPDVDDDVRLGPTIATGALDLAQLDEVASGHLFHPVTTLDTAAIYNTLREQERVPDDRLFGATLARGVLEPLGIEARRPLLAQDELHLADLMARNPLLSTDDVLVPRRDRPFVLAGTALVRDPGRYQWHVPLEVSAMYASLPSDLVLPREVGYVETAGLFGESPEPYGRSCAVSRLAPGCFGLADLWAATGMAPGSLMAELGSRFGFTLDRLVPRVARWAAPSLPDPSPLVDGGVVEPLGIVPLLRRGFDRIVVFLNGNKGVGSSASDRVHGVDGEISRLFGRPASSGYYADDPLHIFAPADLEAVAEGLVASKERGELPWHLGTVHVAALNRFGLTPRPAQVLWMCNDRPSAWIEQLPEDTRNALGLTGLTSGLRAHPHYRVAFTSTDMFRMQARQLNLLAHQWDHAVRAREDAFEAMLA